MVLAVMAVFPRGGAGTAWPPSGWAAWSSALVGWPTSGSLGVRLFARDESIAKPSKFSGARPRKP
jgi:hypothetical protein